MIAILFIKGSNKQVEEQVGLGIYRGKMIKALHILMAHSRFLLCLLIMMQVLLLILEGGSSEKMML